MEGHRGTPRKCWFESNYVCGGVKSTAGKSVEHTL